MQIPQPFFLDVEHEVEAGQRRDDVAVLLVEVGESGIVMKDIHALALREDHPDRTVLEDQPRLAIQKDRHLLVES